MRHDDWLDNADSYICPMCRFECNNPLYYSKTATCPKCGFTPTKYQKLRYAEYTGRNRIIVFNEIMKNYRNGAYGDSDITLNEIFVRAGYPNLMNDMTDEELVYLRDLSAGVLHQVFSFEISKRKEQQDSNGI